MTGPVASGAGGAGRAAIEDGEQFYHNPAAVVHASRVASSLFYADGYTAYQTQDDYYGATVTDNSEDLILSGAFLYAHRFRTYQALPKTTEDYFHLSLGRFVAEHLSVGVAANYLISTIDGDGKTYSQWNGDIGLLYNPIPELGLAFVAYNFIARDTNVPTQVQEVNKLAAGVHYILLDYYHFRFDISQYQVGNPEHLNEYQVGLESKVQSMLMLRTGYDRDELTNSNYWTLGATFDGPRLKIDYSYRQNFDYGGGALHCVDLRLPFW